MADQETSIQELKKKLIRVPGQRNLKSRKYKDGVVGDGDFAPKRPKPATQNNDHLQGARPSTSTVNDSSTATVASSSQSSKSMLYVSTSLTDLQKLITIDYEELTSVENLKKIASDCERNGDFYYECMDEELSYIEYHKFLTLHEIAAANFNYDLPAQSVKKCEQRSDLLSVSLTSRYDLSTTIIIDSDDESSANIDLTTQKDGINLQSTGDGFNGVIPTKTETVIKEQPLANFFNTPGAQSIGWVAEQCGMVPPGAIKGGRRVFVARAEHNGCWVPGSLVPEDGHCLISWQGSQLEKIQYEVLCDDSAEWQSVTETSTIPENAIFGGLDEKGEVLYIGRVRHGNSFTLGKVECSSLKCLVLSHDGSECSYTSFDILVSNPGDDEPDKRSSQLTAAPTVSAFDIPGSSVAHEFNLMPMEPEDEQYQHIKDLMINNCKVAMPYNIVSIHQIWNTKVYHRYASHIKKIEEENNNDANVMALFHGSPKSREIAEFGFDERMSSMNGLFGAGLYFAENSDKSNNYVYGLNAGCTYHNNIMCNQCERLMLLCRVALGRIAQYNQQVQFAHAPPNHHSVKGNLTYSEYIVYRGEQAFPEYLITYTLQGAAHGLKKKKKK